MNTNELEKNWTDRGFSFGIGTLKAGDGIIQAAHDDKDEVVLLESGKYELTIGNKTFIQEGNSEVLIPAGTSHSIKNLGTEDSKIYYGYKSNSL